MKFLKSYVLILLLLSVLGLGAQTPFGVNYQAVLRNSNGQALSGQSATLQFSLTNSTGSAVYYQETHDVTTNTFGLVNAIVGKGTLVSGNYTSVPWKDGGVYLKVDIKVGTATTFTEFERQELHAVPYALFSADGLTVEWKGSLATAPSSPQKNFAYYNTVDKKSYFYDGDSWEILAQDGATGNDGISINWAGTFVSHPTPALNKAYYNYTDKISYIWDGDSWEILAKDGAQGPTGPVASGTLGQTLRHDGTTWVANGTIMVTDSSVNVVPKPGLDPEKPIFAVLNSKGQTVFAVYESAVRTYVGSGDVKGAKGGFAVGGLSTQSKGSVNLLTVSPDSTRIYIDNSTKGAKGGFAVGGLSTQSKGAVDYLRISQDSTRIYIDDSAKGAKGGFAIGGLSTQSKSNLNNYFKVTKDSSFFSNTILSTGDMLVAGNVTTNVGISNDTLVDIDGNKYATIKIGTQVWMKENLKTITYASGDAIGIDSVMVYNNSIDPDTIAKYGRLYSDGAIQSAFGVCPDGWRVPSYADWEILFSFIGGMQWQTNSADIARKIAETGTLGQGDGLWNYDFFQTNTTGFTARPGGQAMQSAGWMYYGMGERAVFWTFETSNIAVIDGMMGTAEIIESSIPAGHSVRCIKN